MRTINRAGLLALALPAWIAAAGEDARVGLTLARELSAGGQHAAAGLEYRRLALTTDAGDDRGAFYWMAGYEYLQARRFDQADRMLAQTEDATSGLEKEVYLLRAENSRARNRLNEAIYYLEGLTARLPPADPARELAAKRLAAARLELRDLDGARAALRELPEPPEQGLAAIDAYENGQDKNPVTGGLLGLIPGLGYAYSGEYANAARSLIMNALCIWGMVEFADREQWAGVAVVGFAGITFYSGSIYGGADSAVRYNRRRLDRCVFAVEGQASFTPDPELLPTLSLRFTF